VTHAGWWWCKRHRDVTPVITEIPPKRFTGRLGDRGGERIRKGVAPPGPPATDPPHVGTSEHVCLVLKNVRRDQEVTT
jgi:hypothetical protein